MLNLQSGGIEIHPSMLEAIQENEKLRANGALPSGRGDFVIVNGQKQFTGFRPTREFYEGAESINIVVPEDWVMKPIDYSTAYSPVQGQVEGSCWAEGCGSAMDLAWNAALGTKLHFSVQDVIDCSGYGTARGGGQLSVSYAADGLALEEDYHYNGHDNRCKKDVPRAHALKGAPIIRGANGGFPTEREINYALHTIGPFEICGSAGALKDGGIHTEMPSNGPTDHCYAHGGMRFDEVLKVWLHGVKNSWGAGDKSRLNPGGRSWGANPAGWGWYRLAKEAGGKIYGSIITELQAVYTGLVPFLPPEPVTFAVENGDLKATITVQPSLVQRLQEIKAAYAKAMGVKS